MRTYYQTWGYGQRDNQRSKVYKMGNELRPTSKKLTRSEVFDLVKKVSEAYGIKTPLIKIIEGGYGRLARANARTITLPSSWALCTETVLHELSHVVIAQKFLDKRNYAPHGPEFMRLFINMYSRAEGVDVSDILALARKHKIKVAAAHLVPQTQAVIHFKLKAVGESK